MRTVVLRFVQPIMEMCKNWKNLIRTASTFGINSGLSIVRRIKPFAFRFRVWFETQRWAQWKCTEKKSKFLLFFLLSSKAWWYFTRLSSTHFHSIPQAHKRKVQAIVNPYIYESVAIKCVNFILTLLLFFSFCALRVWYFIFCLQYPIEQNKPLENKTKNVEMWRCRRTRPSPKWDRFPFNSHPIPFCQHKQLKVIRFCFVGRLLLLQLAR